MAANELIVHVMQQVMTWVGKRAAKEAGASTEKTLVDPNHRVVSQDAALSLTSG